MCTSALRLCVTGSVTAIHSSLSQPPSPFHYTFIIHYISPLRHGPKSYWSSSQLCNHHMRLIINSRSLTDSRNCCEMFYFSNSVTAPAKSAPTDNHSNDEQPASPTRLQKAKKTFPFKHRKHQGPHSLTSPTTADTWTRKTTEDATTDGLLLCCCQCGYATFDDISIVGHAQLHRDVVLRKRSRKRHALRCALCFKKLSSVDTFLAHAQRHIFEQPYQCGYCQRLYATRTRVQQHSASKHRDTDVSIHLIDVRLLSAKCERRLKTILQPRVAVRDILKIPSLEMHKLMISQGFVFCT